MARLSRPQIREMLGRAQNGGTTAEKGRALEDLVCYVFGRIPGVTITHRNRLNEFRSEEVDVAVWNEKRARHLDFLSNIILVEAKNWTQPVGSAEVSWFDRKLSARGLDFGILVAMEGITGEAADKTAAHEIIAAALRDQRRLIVITRRDLEGLQDTQDLVTLIKERLCELAVAGTLFP